METILLSIAVMLLITVVFLLNKKLNKHISDNNKMLSLIERSNVLNRDHFDKEIKRINSELNRNYGLSLDYITVMNFIKNPPKYKIGQKHHKGFIVTDVNYIERCNDPSIYLYEGFSLKTGKRTSAQEEI